MPNDNDKPPIRILHLSDIHFRASKEWDAGPVLRSLTRFIGEEVERGLAPDLVAITGDIAHSGKAEEYALARQWLNALWKKLGGLKRDRLLLVPGNHDVDRGKVSQLTKLSQSHLLEKKSQDEIAKALSEEDNRRILLARHDAYLDFVGKWTRKRSLLPWWQQVVNIHGTKVHIAGLDSAWMACGDDDCSRLLLGRYQLTQTVETTEADGANWRIALLHHPWNYLADFDSGDARRAIHQHRDLVLRGHLHETETVRIVPPDPSRACLELAAGSAYENSKNPNAFQWIELHPAEKRTRVLFRAWLHNDWDIDRNQPGCPEGVAEFDRSAKSKSSGGRGKPVPPTIPTEYIEWLRQSCADISLLGQDLHKGHAVTLSHVYVPAMTTPRALSAEEKLARRTRALGRELEERRPLTLLERLNEGSIYVPAPAGAGKSTFCRWAVLQSIAGFPMSHPVPPPDEFAEPPPKSLFGRLPLLVPLRDFHREMDCRRGLKWHRADLERALAAWVDKSLPDHLSGTLLLAHLKAGSAFVVFDGLDEVPVSEVRDGVTVYPRGLLLSGLADALPGWEKAGVRTLLTSRPYGLDEAGIQRLGLPNISLEPLPEELQELFVARWFQALGKRDKIDDLVQTIRGRDDLAPLIENPMLLTAICILYDSGGRLPEDRYELYKRIIGNVLHSRYPGEAKEREPIKARLEAVAFGMHTGTKDAPRRTPAAEVKNAEVERILGEFAALNPAYASGRVEPVLQREELLNRSGLLVPRPQEQASFYHLSFQEFLAAERIARTTYDPQALEQVFRERWGSPEWRLTLFFLFAAQLFTYRDAQWGLDLLGRLTAGQERTALKTNPAPAVFIAEALELCLAKSYTIPEDLKGAFERICREAIEDEVDLKSRQALGLCLGRLGDPRIHDLRGNRAYEEVPAGTYPVGEDKEKRLVTIAKPFLLGKYPVTNGQYRAFMADGGYSRKDLWSKEGLAWLREEQIEEPRYWRDRRWNAPNQPVVGVSSWEAEACAAWAGSRLPKEEEWEAAARGPKGLDYPWGNEWTDGICNSLEASLGVTSPVGLFPRSRQEKLGIEDLAGNVWEWCQGFYRAGDPSSGRVLRGGSWSGDRNGVRSVIRYGFDTGFRDGDIGFRVARTI